MLSVIICTYKRPQLLSNCLAGAVQVLDALDSEIIVVNDSKTDEPVLPKHPKIRLLNSTKQGVASARNVGAMHALGELLLFVDDDIEFDLKNVQDLLAVYNTREPACYNPNWRYSDEMYAAIKATQFGRFLIHYQLVNYKGWVTELNWQDQVFEAKQLAAFFMLVPKVFFKQAGGFDESFTNQGTEDDELCRRFHKLGIKMFVDPENYVFHNEMDRITLGARLQRFYHGAINRRRAFDMGIASYEIKYSSKKEMLLRLVLPFESLLLWAAKIIPNRPSLDFLYFKIADALTAIVIYKGYTGRK